MLELECINPENAQTRILIRSRAHRLSQAGSIIVICR
jgi:hypothetical protein